MIKKEPLGFLDPRLIPWHPEGGVDGLYAKTLARCATTGSYTRMLKFLPGTDTSAAGVQAHGHLEELWLVSGAIHDLSLERTFTAGMYANRLRGMGHGPWTAGAGALILEVRDSDPDGLITKEQTEFTDPDLIEWSEADPEAGFYVKTLTACSRTGSFGRLVKMQPGATKPGRVSGDRARSELWVVDGQLHNVETGLIYPSGTYGNVDVDLIDGSWTTIGGCVVFEIRNLI